jgi:DNA-binding MarR family transcriptional regulator
MKENYNYGVKELNVEKSLIVASNLLKRRMEHQITEFSPNDDQISASNAQIIGFLVVNKDQEIFQKTIEQAFSLRPSTVSANLRLMETKGFIKREFSKLDARKKRVIPTQKAIDFNEKLCKKGVEIEEEFIEIFNNDEYEELKSLLLKLIVNMEQKEKSPL